MVRLPMPADLLRLGERGYAAVEQAVGLVPRVAALVGQLERIAARAEAAIEAVEQTRHRADQLVERAGGVIGQTEQVLTGTAGLVRQAEQLLAGTDQLLAGAGQVSKRAEVLIGETSQVLADTRAITGQAGELLGGFEPTLNQLSPVLDRLAATTSPAEVDAVILLIDVLPELVERMRKEVLPILATMTNVAPDIRELLDTTKEFTALLGSLPGLGRLKRRVEEHEQEHDAQRAEIEASVERP